MSHRRKATNDSMIKEMLQAQENHAKIQKKDYSHVFRKKSFFEILRLSALGLGLGFVYAAETAFVSPTLLQIGVDHSTMTLVWGLSPTLGLILGPLVGSTSDRCRLSLGRRRPALMLLFIGIIVGLFLIPFGKNIGHFFGDDSFEMTSRFVGNITENMQEPTTISATTYKPNIKFAVFLTIFGTMLLDFNVETCQAPAKAYMLDVCIPEDQGKALSMFSVMAGLGSTIGYIIGGIEWQITFIGRFFGGNIQTIFTIGAFFMAMCFFVTFWSFSEIPLPLIERDKLLRPFTVRTTKDESGKSIISNQVYHILESLMIASDDKVVKNPDVCSSQISIDNIDADIEAVSLRKYLKSIFLMPRSMLILNLTHMFCWMGLLCYCLYFTDYVGDVVFNGDPTAPIESEEYKLYEAGLRYGSKSMTVFALCSSLYSFIIEKLMVRFTSKHVYIFGIMIFSAGMFFLAAWPNKLGVLIVSATAGIMYATVNTVPFIIVAKYHEKNCFELCNGEYVPLKEPRGLGTDIAIITNMLFVGQLLISLNIGYLIRWTNATKAVFYASSGLSACGAIAAMFVLII